MLLSLLHLCTCQSGLQRLDDVPQVVQHQVLQLQPGPPTCTAKHSSSWCKLSLTEPEEAASSASFTPLASCSGAPCWLGRPEVAAAGRQQPSSSSSNSDRVWVIFGVGGGPAGSCLLYKASGRVKGDANGACGLSADDHPTSQEVKGQG